MAGLKQTLAAHKIIMEISLLIMEKSWNNHGIWILNFCGNPVYRNFVELESPMLHAKFQDHRFSRPAKSPDLGRRLSAFSLHYRLWSPFYRRNRKSAVIFFFR